MAKLENFVLRPIHQLLLRLCKLSPEEEDNGGLVRTDGANDGIGELFPTFALV